MPMPAICRGGDKALYADREPDVPLDLSAVATPDLVTMRATCNRIKASIQAQLTQVASLFRGRNHFPRKDYIEITDWQARAKTKIVALDNKASSIRDELRRRAALGSKRGAGRKSCLYEFVEAIWRWPGAPAEVVESAGRLMEHLEQGMEDHVKYEPGEDVP